MSNEKAQPIRPTQFITTYGPGAIIETLHGPRLIYDLRNSELFTEKTPRDFEIVEPALSQLLPQNGRIFRFPNNSDYEVEDSTPIYQTTPFPRWSLCIKHNLLYRYNFKEGIACPHCPKVPRWKAYEQAGLQAINFVLACADGHLDDVPWSWYLHSGTAGCRPETIIWKGAGGPLRGVVLVCPDCKASIRLSDLYHQDHKCSGCFPEQKSKGNDICIRKAVLCQRGATDLHLPSVITSLTLPQVDSKLREALSNSEVAPVLRYKLRVKKTLDEADWQEILSDPKLAEGVKKEIASAPLGARQIAAEHLDEDNAQVTVEESRSLELKTLLEAANTGKLKSSNFELDCQGARSFLLGESKLRVTPVTRLRIVAAQVGYSRLSGARVETGYRYGGGFWFAGVEQYGEGLFLDLDSLPRSCGPVWQRWQQRFLETGKIEEHPMMVWWHTLSHRLIRALAIDSGYSAASVRERLYLDGDKGGLLIYAVQPGGDGTLGGLVALVPRFARILRFALDSLDVCSNDPLCGEQKVSSLRKSGASCYACCLLSETSCEMRNLSLDRKLLLETL